MRAGRAFNPPQHDDDDDDGDNDDPMILNNRAKNHTSERTIVPWTVIFYVCFTKFFLACQNHPEVLKNIIFGKDSSKYFAFDTIV